MAIRNDTIEGTISAMLMQLEQEELCYVIKEHPHYIKYLKKQSENVCLIAVHENPKVLCLVRNQTKSICLEAVSIEYWTISMVRELTDDIVIQALTQSLDAINYLPQEWYDKYYNKVYQ